VTSSGDTLVLLPEKYYTLNPLNTFSIPNGSFVGSVEVQLDESFLLDSNAIKLYYVIPLQITGTSADSILSGDPAISEGADPRVAGDWNTLPMDFTIFGIKFINQYHGKYLHRGRSIIRDGAENILDTVIYRERYVEQNEIWALNTIGRDAVSVSGLLRNATGGTEGNISMKLMFDENGESTVASTSDSDFPVSGTGKFIKNGDSWGGKERDAIFLNYIVNTGTSTHTIVDTLVFRDKDVRFERFTPVVLEN
jgi:hypothetical protein